MASRSSEVPSRPETAVDLQQFIAVAYDLANSHMDGVAPMGGPGSTVQSDVEQLIKKIQYNMAEMGRLKEMHTLVIQLILFRREEIGKQLEQLQVLAQSWKEPNLDMDGDDTHGWDSTSTSVVTISCAKYAICVFWTSMRMTKCRLPSSCVLWSCYMWLHFLGFHESEFWLT